MRDYDSDRVFIKTTVILLGKKRSLVLCLKLFLLTFPLLFMLIIYGVVPLEILLLLPLVYFIINPIFKAIKNEDYEDNMLEKIRKRRLILIGSLITSIIWGKMYSPLYLLIRARA